MTEKLAQLLPKSFLVKSAGSYYPGFSHPNGFAHQLFRIGMLLILTPFVLFLGQLCPKDNLRLSRRLRYSLIIPTTIAVALLYYQLAMPPMFSPSNARMLWVEPLVFGSKFWSTYPFLCILHRMFYDMPGVLVALSAVALFWSSFLLSRYLRFGWEMSFLAALALILSSPILNFAQVAEGVLSNTALLCFSVYAYLRFGGVVGGIGVFLSSLGRPQFLSLVPAMLLAELIQAVRSSDKKTSIWNVLRSSSLAPLLLTFAVLYMGWQLFAFSEGFSLFYHYGESSNELLSHSAPRGIEGFEISPFSGAYFGHFWWQLPTVVVLLWAISFVICPRFSAPQMKLLVVSAVIVMCNLTFHEAFPIFYYNIRYLTYYYPLIHLVAFIPIARYLSQHSSVGLLLGLLFVFASMAPYSTAFEASKRAENSPFVSLYEHRHVLRKWSQGLPIMSTPLDWRTKNYLAYVFQSDRLIQESSEVALANDGLYILAELPAQGCSEVLNLNKLYFCRVFTPII